jgi:uroporphyrinogen decarboxylase
MSEFVGLSRGNHADADGLIDTLLGRGEPKRVYHMELFHDVEIRRAIGERFGLLPAESPEDPVFDWKLTTAVNRFCGWDYVVAGPQLVLSHHMSTTDDTAGLAREDGRSYQDSHTGPIMSWEDFEKFQWPDPHAPELTASLDWYQENLPEGMCIVGGLTGHFCEELTWLMGYETLCYALFEQPDLVEAVARRLGELFAIAVDRMLEYDRVRMIWSSDDMGFKTGTFLSPEHMRKHVLANHRDLAKRTHDAGRVYLLHACGNLAEIIDDLIDDVKIDAKHSYEDTIEDVRQVKKTYGQRVAMIGGIDVDFLCRSEPEAIRRRVRETLEVCQPGGRYALGTGNSVANYIPLENYLTMVDEGMLFSG